ncbi:beta-glucosidase BglX [Aquimarina sp. U1-2]|uniref:beta-glucosidase BglX n=1 Tax=Aquimarina sp. U1-2 TaxID=2823141 RepID=UPI001AED0FB8|nr:beta-glucosidase BglX [Aquimarina sp. U1-2]MBP2833455.1 beta-glucosidase BglX [Aquimarina sp. U1-2]
MKSSARLLIFLVFLVFIFSSQTRFDLNKRKTRIDAKVDSLLSLMTLEEKIGQMNQYNGFWDVTGPVPQSGASEKKYEHLKKGWVGSMLNVRGAEEVRKVQEIAVKESRLGIPLLIGFDVIHGYKTLSPIPLAEAASWDLEAIKRSAENAALEASAAGINWTFAPMVDISRDARWGRVMEGAGEDPFLGAQIARARVQGFQGNDLSEKHTIAACAKHLAGYGFAEGGRDYNTVDIGNSTLYNIVFPPFKAAQEAGVRTFMNAFNELNGVPATGSEWLQRDILKKKWGFTGFIVSDWGSIAEMINHGRASNGKEAAAIALQAGSDMDMESYLYVEHLTTLVKEGKVEASLIDDAARRILKVKYELGLFEDPYRYCDKKREDSIIGNDQIREMVLDMAKKSIVLLKNDKNLLPLKKQGLHIGVIGALANDKDSPLGSWRIAAEDSSAISVLEALKDYRASNTITYAKGADLYTNKTSFTNQVKINQNDKSGFSEALKVAKSSDVVIMVLGEVGYQSGEARSRTRLGLPGVQQQLLEAVFQVNSNIILILNNGRPLAITWADKHIPSIVEAWQLGSQSGNAIAEVLYGDYNPSGKLPVSFPRSVGQVPVYYNYKNTGRPSEPAPDVVFWSHYIDEENTPLYPFGYGLSYTEFTYENLQLQVKKSKIEDPLIEASVKVVNTGEYDGKEVVQLYIRDRHASITRPVKELKGFELVSLKKGESQTISFQLDSNTLGFYDNNYEFVVEPGIFDLFIGGSSDTTLATSFEITQ